MAPATSFRQGIDVDSLLQTCTVPTVSDSVILDELDRRIVAALQIDARAPFGLIAEVLGESERKVARRTQRLLETGALHLTAFVDELATGLGLPTSLRIKAVPGAVDSVAEALAERPDTRAVVAVTGETALSCELVAGDRDSLHRALSHDLPDIPGLLECRSYPVLRHVKSIAAWQTGVLSARDAAALRGDPPVTVEAGLGDDDTALLALLTQDARSSYVDLAERLGVTPATARRRVERLLATGTVTLRAEIEPALLGYDTEMELWLDVEPARIEAVAERLAAHPTVRYCGVVAGGSAVNVIAVVDRPDGMYRFLTGVVGVERDITRSEVTVVTHAYKRGYIRKREQA
jgi:DNA-binding Lrp family transcriptional regulator